MHRPNLGVNADDFRLPAKEALQAAAELEFAAVELGAAAGQVTPESLSDSGRRHVRRYIQDLGLRLASLGADIPGLRLTDPRSVEERISRTRRILELARELGAPVVTTGVGALTHPETGEPSPVGLAALRNLGELADSLGTLLALRPFGEPADRLGRVLHDLACPSIRLCLDPAALVIHGIRPGSLIERFPKDVLLVHARDGTVGRADRPGQETGLGDGDSDWNGLIALLRDADYAGEFIVHRTDAVRPVAELREARDTLRGWLA